MKIETSFYLLDFPKYARKWKTTLVPSSPKIKENVVEVLGQAHIKFVCDGTDQIGIEGKFNDVVSKLQVALKNKGGLPAKESQIAKRLCSDLQFRAILG